MKRRIAVLHNGIVASYRARFFELLNKTSQHDYVVFHGPAPKVGGLVAAQGPFDFPNQHVWMREFSLMARKVYWQPVIKPVTRGGYDALIIGHELKFLANNLLFAWFKLTGKPAIYWGHGVEIKRDLKGLARAARAAAVPVKYALAKFADTYLAYTAGGKENLTRHGLHPERVAVIRNTIDMTEQLEHYHATRTLDPQQLRQQLNLLPDSVVLTYMGRFISEKRIEQLLDAVAAIHQQKSITRPIEVLLIGQGPELDTLKHQYNNLDRVQFLGRVEDEHHVARCLRVTTAVVVPGKIGLVINHAFAHGVPVITRPTPLHSPEIEYLEHGHNGLLIDGNFDNFVDELTAFIQTPERQEKLAQGALETRDSLSLDAMVHAYDHAVSRLLERPNHAQSSCPKPH